MWHCTHFSYIHRGCESSHTILSAKPLYTVPKRRASNTKSWSPGSITTLLYIKCQRKDWYVSLILLASSLNRNYFGRPLHKKKCREFPQSLEGTRAILDLAVSFITTDRVLAEYLMWLACSALDLPAFPNRYKTHFVMMDWSLKERAGSPDSVYLDCVTVCPLKNGPDILLNSSRYRRARREGPQIHICSRAQDPRGTYIELHSNDPLPPHIIKVNYSLCSRDKCVHQRRIQERLTIHPYSVDQRSAKLLQWVIYQSIVSLV